LARVVLARRAGQETPDLEFPKDPAQIPLIQIQIAREIARGHPIALGQFIQRATFG